MHENDIFRYQKLKKDKNRLTAINQFLDSLPSYPVNKSELRWLGKAKEIALAYSDGRANAKVGCLFIEKHTIIAQGYGLKKTHPLQAKYNTYSDNIHAEVMALLEATKRGFNPNKTTVVVVAGLNKHGERCSYPCRYCWPLLSYSGLRRIVCYS